MNLARKVTILGLGMLISVSTAHAQEGIRSAIQMNDGAHFVSVMDLNHNHGRYPAVPVQNIALRKMHPGNGILRRATIAIKAIFSQAGRYRAWADWVGPRTLDVAGTAIVSTEYGDIEVSCENSTQIPIINMDDAAPDSLLHSTCEAVGSLTITDPTVLQSLVRSGSEPEYFPVVVEAVMVSGLSNGTNTDRMPTKRILDAMVNVSYAAERRHPQGSVSFGGGSESHRVDLRNRGVTIGNNPSIGR